MKIDFVKAVEVISGEMCESLGSVLGEAASICC